MDELTESVKQRVNILCARFKAEWSAQQGPALADYLAEFAGPSRAYALEKLLPIELDLRRAASETPRVEDYIDRLPGDGEIVQQLFIDRLPWTLHEQAERPGTRVGPYTLLEKIGEGGFGVVYAAEQKEPVRRRVALKIIKPGMDSREVIARFEAERRALAMMDHPNIARVLDAGQTEQARPYFVMELVNGVPITTYCDDKRLAIRERLKSFMAVCHAVQHAHQKAVIHRDIKPSNVLVAEQDGTMVAKVIDFGVAKALGQTLADDTIYTGLDAMIGTLEYMSPEQTAGSALDIDTRSDIYALGVLLFELLTGTLPLDSTRLRGAGHDERRRMICEEEPPRPSARLDTLGEALPAVAERRGADPKRLARQMRGDLDWIVMKALEKEPNRRYGTASGLAADIQRYLDNEPVEARPPSAAYRVRKFVGRNRTLVTAASIVLFVLLSGIVGTSYGLVEASAARDQAVQRADQLQKAAEYHYFVMAGFKPSAMDQRIVAHLRRRVEQGLARRGAASDYIRTALTSFDERLFNSRIWGRGTSAQLILDEDFNLPADDSFIFSFYADSPRDGFFGSSFEGFYNGHDSAIAFHEAALESLRAELGDDHPDTLRSINNLGALLQWSDNPSDAEPYLREALNGFRRVLGNDHPHTLTSIQNLGFLLHTLYKPDEAEPYYRESLDGFRRVLGDDHPYVLASIIQLAHLLYSNPRKRAEAEPYYRESLDGFRRVLGNDHPKTLTSIQNLGMRLQGMGRPHEAEQYYREALEGFRRVLGNDDSETLSSIHRLGNLLHRMGRLDEAERYYCEALDGFRRVHGDDEFSTLSSSCNLGGLLLGMGKTPEAERLLLEAYRGHTDRAKTSPSSNKYDDIEIRNHLEPVLHRLVDLYEVLNKRELAEAYRWELAALNKGFGQATVCRTVYDRWVLGASHPEDFDRVVIR